MTAAGTPRKRMHLAAHFPGVNNTTVWTDPDSGSQIEPTLRHHPGLPAPRPVPADRGAA